MACEICAQCFLCRKGPEWCLCERGKGTCICHDNPLLRIPSSQRLPLS